MFIQCGTVRKCLSTKSAFHLRTAIGVHSFMSAKIGELCIGLEANFTLKWFDGRMNMHVLFETTGCSEGLAAFSTGMMMMVMMMFAAAAAGVIRGMIVRRRVV